MSLTRDRLRRCLGETLWQGLRGSLVLECGCGAGRFTEVLLAAGAQVMSIDMSDAVDANQMTFPQSATHRLAQADIRRLPFALRSFAIVLCVGVVQHTPSPDETIARLYDYVRPGGSLVVDHYAFAPSWYLRTAPLFRRWLLTKRPGSSLRVVERLVDRFLPLHRRFANSRVVSRLLNRISPLITYYSAYPELPDDLQREWALLDTHDSLTDRFKHRRTAAHIRRVLEGLRAEHAIVLRIGDVIEARASRPAGG